MDIFESLCILVFAIHWFHRISRLRDSRLRPRE